MRGIEQDNWKYTNKKYEVNLFNKLIQANTNENNINARKNLRNDNFLLRLECSSKTDGIVNFIS